MQCQRLEEVIAFPTHLHPMPQMYGLWLVLELGELERKCEVTNRIMLRYTDDVTTDQINILGYTPRGEGGVILLFAIFNQSYSHNIG